MYFAYFSNATQKGTQRAVTTTIFFLVPLQLHIIYLPWSFHVFFSQAWQFCNASSCAAADSQRLEGAPGISWRLGTGVAGCDSRDSAQGTFSSRFASLGFFGDSAAALFGILETCRNISLYGSWWPFSNTSATVPNHPQERMLNTSEYIFQVWLLKSSSMFERCVEEAFRPSGVFRIVLKCTTF